MHLQIWEMWFYTLSDIFTKGWQHISQVERNKKTGLFFQKRHGPRRPPPPGPSKFGNSSLTGIWQDTRVSAPTEKEGLVPSHNDGHLSGMTLSDLEDWKWDVASPIRDREGQCPCTTQHPGVTWDGIHLFNAACPWYLLNAYFCQSLIQACGNTWIIKTDTAPLWWGVCFQAGDRE